MFPIPVRVPALVLTEIFFGASFGFLWLLWDAFPDISPPCGIVLVLSFITFWTAFHIIMVRVVLLWTWDLLTRLSIKYESQLDGKSLTQISADEVHIFIPEKIQRLIARHRHWIKPKTTLLIAVNSWISVCGFYAIILYQWYKASGGQLFNLPYHSDECIQFEKQEIGWGALLIGLPCIVGAIIFMLTATNDNFGLYNELGGSLLAGFWLVFVCLVSQIPQFHEVFFQMNIYHFVTGFFSDCLILWLTSFRVIIWTYLTDPNGFQISKVRYNWQPLKWKTSQQASTSHGDLKSDLLKDDASDAAMQLHSVLQSKDGLKLFENFLRKEYAIENILFYNACQSLKRIASDEYKEDFLLKLESVIRTANSIKDKFIKNDAVLCVNVSAKTRSAVLGFLAKHSTPDDFKKEHPDDLTILSMPDEEFLKTRTLTHLDEKFDISSPANSISRIPSPSSSLGRSFAEKSREKLLIPLGSIFKKEKKTIIENYDLEKVTLLGSLFDEAEYEITQLMEKDSFKRFVKSHEYQRWKKYGKFVEGIQVPTDNDGADDPSSAKSSLTNVSTEVNSSQFNKIWKRRLRQLSCLPRNLENLDGDRFA
jgi:hypothetical protein